MQTPVGHPEMGAYSVSAVRGAEANLPTAAGDMRIFAYRDIQTGKEHAAVVKGDVTGAADVLTRVHSECLTGDLFGSLRCDCGPQLEEALAAIEEAGRGVVLYLRQEGRGIGLIDKIAAYELQEQGLDTVEANLQLGHPEDARTYEAAHDMLKDLQVQSIRLMTNNPAKVEALRGFGIEITDRVPHEVGAGRHNRDYLATKKAKMGHLLDKL